MAAHHAFDAAAAVNHSAHRPLPRVDGRSKLLHSLHMAQAVTPVNTSAVLQAVWQAVRLLTGDNGLHADDHLTRLEVLTQSQRALELAIDAELHAAHDDGASLSQLGRALGGMSKQAALKRLRRPERQGTIHQQQLGD